jgi:hypothetical protein
MNTQKNKAFEPEINNEVLTDKRRELLGEELMTWNIKAHPHSMFATDLAMAIGGMAPLGIMLYGYFGNDDFPFHILGIFGMCFWLFMWLKGARQKTSINTVLLIKAEK